MKRNNLLLGSFGIVVIAAIAVFTALKSGDSKYSMNDLSSLQPQNANDYQEWLKARYIDLETGEPISPEKLRSIRKQLKALATPKSLMFVERGPDNIGGRTRAILIDRANSSRIWAGGVSGGLFTSTNGGTSWSRVTTYPGSALISSMTMTKDGKMFVATGSLEENSFGGGNGVWRSDDKGISWSIVSGTDAFNYVNEIVADDVNNVVWMAAGSDNVQKYDVSTNTLSSVPVGSGATTTIQISKDGNHLVAASNTNNHTFVSNDGGTTWNSKGGASSSNLVPIGAWRIEYAISPTKNSSGNYSMYAVRTNSNLQGMNVSHDNGVTWYQFIGTSTTPGYLDIYRDQGTYNSIVSVLPSNPEKIMIGGIDIWKWEQTVNNPPSGGFEKLTNWFASPTSPTYVHADNHEMKWAGNKLYMGNDGGIGITSDLVNFYPANKGYNVTQFYGMAFDRDGNLMGGTQDNGTLYNNGTLFSPMSFSEVSGGDGFECEISFFNPKVMFSTIYYNSVSRSGDGGLSFNSFNPTYPTAYGAVGSGGTSFPFHTEIFMAEHYDLNSEDSVQFIAFKDYPAGSSIRISSKASGDSMTYVTPVPLYFDDTVQYNPALTTTDTFVVNLINGSTVTINNYNWVYAPSDGAPFGPGDSVYVDFPTGTSLVIVDSYTTSPHYYGQNGATGEIVNMGIETEIYNVAWDTVMVQDPYQSWFFIYVNQNGGELWGTRNALRLASADYKWGVVARGIGGGLFNSIDVEFSRDLNAIYISGGSNGVHRLDGLGDLYTSNPDFMYQAVYGIGPVGVSNIVAGRKYRITVSGSTNFMAIGASSNAIGTEFVATGPGTGTGQALQIPSGTTITKISTVNCEGIAVNPNNPDDLLLMQKSSGVIKRSLDATAAIPNFTDLTNISTPNPAVFDGIIDRNDPDILVVGTSEGAFYSEDGGASWMNASAGFEGTPVFEVRQSWRTYAEGNMRDGEIYLATHGRGIWSSTSYLGLNDGDGSGKNEEFKTKLKSFPNPTTNSTNLSFNLKKAEDVTVLVYNISGKLVKTINRKNVGAGEQTINIDAHNLPQGTYIVKFNAGEQNATTKFIKM